MAAKGTRKTKNFVLDTNVILYAPHCLETFADNNIHIPAIVLEEIDSLKKSGDLRGYNAREFIRLVERYRLTGNLRDGVRLDSGGMLFVVLSDGAAAIPPDFSNSKNDNIILGAALGVKERSRQETTLISKDVNLRIKANVLGLAADDYNHEKTTTARPPEGECTVGVPDDVIDAIYAAAPDRIFDIDSLGLHDPPPLNGYRIFKSTSNDKKSALMRYSGDPRRQGFRRLTTVDDVLGITPVNAKQRFLLDALLDPAVQIVFAIGIAGTGKTLLSLAAGMLQVLSGPFKKLVATRSPVPMGRDLGYLPGDIQEKLDPWLKPIYDNLELIIDNLHDDAPGFKDEMLIKRQYTEITMDYLRQTKMVEIDALTYIRGRTYNDSFIVIDESQNLTPHEAKTIITRAGNNTKLILTGDPEQIDNPYLDERDNGLVNAAEKFRLNNSGIAATVILDKCERSRLADEAAQIL
ncbi:MAG: PhoH family protein [Deltaproteobacteria bacterium]|nr:PhoH family protein [Candidatus Anaeroferrophillacea bacterium]